MDLLPIPVFFFALGAAAALVRSDLAVPDGVAKGLSLYLMLAIGVKGGIAVASPGGADGLLPALVAGLALSFLLPVPAYAALRAFTGVNRPTAAAVAGHYGSVSIVTFAAAMAAVEASGLRGERFLPAVLAAMETPAIVTALLLAQRGGAPRKPSERARLVREVLASGSIVLLLGSFAIGWIGGGRAAASLSPFIEGLFPGALCLFLLDMGIVAARQLRSAPKTLNARLIAFGILMPLFASVCGLGAGALAGLSPGGVALMAVLAASASYIAVPAAMRLALPEADPGVYVTLALAVTFPFNIVLGIPLYIALAQRLVGG